MIHIDFSKTVGPIKRMHCVNNGPMKRKTDQINDNYDTYKALKIPFARNHDASFSSEYGGSHTVDVCNIFPDFNADVNDPASYDFVLTDEYVARTHEVGTKTFYRLGSKIEHEIKKYGTLPPPDFQKWAEICEHIIRHMNEGWADGHHFGIEYWEIWNEADGAKDDDDYYWHKCWGGTEAQFHDFYEIAAKHLKKCFPDLKIGGPAATCPSDWLERFLSEMKKRNVPIDFVSYHCYTNYPDGIRIEAEKGQAIMDRCGYGDAENILNEWNYVRGWTDDYVYSIEAMHGVKGAAFTMATISLCQPAPVDMLMYYDARPSTQFNGMWDFYTSRPIPGYYPFVMFGKLYEMGSETFLSGAPESVYATAATDGRGKNAVMLSCYTDEDDDKKVRRLTLSVQGTNATAAVVTFVDEKHPVPAQKELPVQNGRIHVTMKPGSFMLIEL